jgi:methyl-accepting chemotaxis protein
MAFLKNQRLFVKVFFLFLMVLLLSVFSHILVAQRVQTQFLQKQAKSIARQIILTRQWIAGLGGVWSKDVYSDAHGFLTQYKEPETTDEAAIFYLHNPALATREISSLADIKYGYTFTVVSDFFREPKNKPDPFELAAIKKIKAEKIEYTDAMEGDLYRYTEPLFVKKGCLKCHGDLEKDVKEPMKSILLEKYGNTAFGYKVGDVRGIISIKIPRDNWATILGSVFNQWNYVILVATIVLFYLFTRFVFVNPITRLTKAALQLSKGKLDVDFGIKATQQNSRDEMAQLAMAFERLRKSFLIVMRKFSKSKKV